MKHEAVILRVDRNRAGAIFPFDKVYFFEKSAEDTLPRIFTHAFVISPTTQFVNMVRDVVWNSVGHMVCQTGKAHALSRRDEHKLKERMDNRHPIYEVIANPQGYLAVIPMLFLRGRANREKTEKPAIYPIYIHAPGKVRFIPMPGNVELNKERNMKNMMSTAAQHAYFLSEGEAFRPICVLCPRSLYMLSGQCQFGDIVCYSSLAQIKPGDYQKNMRKYREWVGALEEPEIGEPEEQHE